MGVVRILQDNVNKHESCEYALLSKGLDLKTADLIPYKSNELFLPIYYLHILF